MINADSELVIMEMLSPIASGRQSYGLQQFLADVKHIHRVAFPHCR